MSFNQFTNLDFTDIKTQIKDYLRANTNFSDFDFEGSNFSTLIEILAYNSYITAFNTNMAVNESFLDSATLRENVVSLAKNIGYVPRSKRAAIAKINFSVFAPTDSNGNALSKSITLKAGVVALGSIESGNYIFSIPEDITVLVSNDGYANFQEINVYEGVYLLKSYVYSDTQSNQKFIIPNAGVDASTIRVEVVNDTKEKYNLYSNIFELNKDSKTFLLQEIEDEQYEIIFGDNILGKKPKNGSGIFISYIVTNGSSGNGPSNFTFSGSLIDNNNNVITSGISLVTTQSPAQNGDEIESIDSIKYLAPRVYASQYRAVTATDYQSLIPFIFPYVDSVTAYGGEELNPPEYGKVYVSIKPKNSSFLSKIAKEDIKRELKKYTIAGTNLEIIDLKYLYVELDVTAYYNQSMAKSAVDLKTNIISTIQRYSQSKDLNSFGGRFKYSKVVSLIDGTSTSVTSNITKVKIRRNLFPSYNLVANYELCFGNSFHISSNSYNIKSSGFFIFGSSDTLYFGDIPDQNKSTGKIIIFKIVNNIPVIVIQDAGIIDYKKGEILLNPITITKTVIPDIIQIQAIPESNDVIALKDIYLELNTENTVVNVISDTISSGENSSGTQYSQTSSYSNGSYIR